MSKLPFKLRELVRQLRELDREVKKKIGILILGDDEESVAQLREELTKSAPQGKELVKTVVIGEGSLPKLESVDFFIAVLKEDIPPLWLRELVAKRSKVLVAWLREEESGKIKEEVDNLARSLRIASYKIVALAYLVAENEMLFRIARVLRGKEIALAVNLPLFRTVVAEEIVHRIARQNAVIGVATFLPGSDMPILTTNQARMILSLAFCFGEELSLSRAIELLAVLGGGFTFRALARQLLTFLPGPGWVVKGGVAYSGTLAMGEAAIRYFERRGV